MMATYREIPTEASRISGLKATFPAPLECVRNVPCEGACAISYCCAFTDNVTLKTVGEVEEFFAEVSLFTRGGRGLLYSFQPFKGVDITGSSSTAIS